MADAVGRLSSSSSITPVTTNADLQHALQSLGETLVRLAEAFLVEISADQALGTSPPAPRSDGFERGSSRIAFPAPTSLDGASARREVPFYSQFDAAHVTQAGEGAGWRACRAMAKAGGVNLPAGTGDRIDVLRDDGSVDHDLCDEALAYLDHQLSNRRSVGAVLQEGDGRRRPVVVTSAGENGVRFHDPSFRDAGAGANRTLAQMASGNLAHVDERGRQMQLQSVVRSHGGPQPERVVVEKKAPLPAGREFDFKKGLNGITRDEFATRFPGGFANSLRSSLKGLPALTDGARYDAGTVFDALDRTDDGKLSAGAAGGNEVTARSRLAESLISSASAADRASFPTKPVVTLPEMPAAVREAPVKERIRWALENCTHGTTGDCYRSVKTLLKATAGVELKGSAAHQAADQLAACEDGFQERKLDASKDPDALREQLRKLPAGAVIVYGPSKNHPWGHIGIRTHEATGKGAKNLEMSDQLRDVGNPRNYGSIRVFIPKDAPRTS